MPGKINVEMILMVFVSIRPQHCCETLAGAAMHRPQKGLLRRFAPPASLYRNLPSIRQKESGNVQRIGKPML